MNQSDCNFNIFEELQRITGAKPKPQTAADKLQDTLNKIHALNMLRNKK